MKKETLGSLEVRLDHICSNIEDEGDKIEALRLAITNEYQLPHHDIPILYACLSLQEVTKSFRSATEQLSKTVTDDHPQYTLVTDTIECTSKDINIGSASLTIGVPEAAIDWSFSPTSVALYPLDAAFEALDVAGIRGGINGDIEECLVLSVRNVLNYQQLSMNLSDTMLVLFAILEKLSEVIDTEMMSADNAQGCSCVNKVCGVIKERINERIFETGVMEINIIHLTEALMTLKDVRLTGVVKERVVEIFNEILRYEKWKNCQGNVEIPIRPSLAHFLTPQIDKQIPIDNQMVLDPLFPTTWVDVPLYPDFDDLLNYNSTGAAAEEKGETNRLAGGLMYMRDIWRGN